MGSTDGIVTIGLGPIVLGLGAIVLLCAMPWIVRLAQASNKPAAPGEEEAFDPDAALARYLARKVGEADPPEADMPVREFGRKAV